MLFSYRGHQQHSPGYDGTVVEIHISQVHKREEFRHHSFVSYRADAVIAGLGIEGYVAAVRYICNQ